MTEQSPEQPDLTWSLTLFWAAGQTTDLLRYFPSQVVLWNWKSCVKFYLYYRKILFSAESVIWESYLWSCLLIFCTDKVIFLPPHIAFAYWPFGWVWVFLLVTNVLYLRTCKGYFGRCRLVRNSSFRDPVYIHIPWTFSWTMEWPCLSTEVRPDHPLWSLPTWLILGFFTWKLLKWGHLSGRTE